MAESNKITDNNISINDALDINELASLDEEISTDFIEQLQNQIATENKTKNDGNLFEEVSSNEPKEHAVFNNDIDDNFIKKYKAKLQKQQAPAKDAEKETAKPTLETKPNTLDSELPARTIPTADKKEEAEQEKVAKPKEPKKEGLNQPEPQINDTVEIAKKGSNVLPEPQTVNEIKEEKSETINTISGGYINEKPFSQENADYKNSLDYLDNNVKYSKYVIYIDPENKEFIDSLTVKERKNLINRIIHEQDAIAVTKQRLGKMQAIIKHLIIAILTITISIPILYWTINTSLEVTINNYRQSQSIFETLYKEQGKLKKVK